MSDQPTNRHLLRRTSPKGQDFIGTCSLCGRTGLSLDRKDWHCENPRGLTQDEAVVEAVQS